MYLRALALNLLWQFAPWHLHLHVHVYVCRYVHMIALNECNTGFGRNFVEQKKKIMHVLYFMITLLILAK